MEQLKRKLKYVCKRTKQLALKLQERSKRLHDQRCKGAKLEVGDIVLVRHTAWKGRHKIQDRLEDEEYQIVGQPTPSIPAYKVQTLDGGNKGFLTEIYFYLNTGC